LSDYKVNDGSCCNGAAKPQLVVHSLPYPCVLIVTHTIYTHLFLKIYMCVRVFRYIKHTPIHPGPRPHTCNAIRPLVYRSLAFSSPTRFPHLSAFLHRNFLPGIRSGRGIPPTAHRPSPRISVSQHVYLHLAT